MKSLAIILLLQVALVIPASLFGQEQKKEEPKSATMKCWVSIDCESCKAKIEKNLPFEKGVTGLKVDLPTKTVEVTYKTAKTSPEKLEKALQKLGYKTEILPPSK